MSEFDKIRDKAEEWAKDNPEKAEKYSDEGIQRAGDAADRATGGKHADKVREGEERLDDLVGDDGDTPSRADEEKGGL
ncbi:MAG TPA: antitoxin [Actinomycetales bacterium]|jgi:hypothetical protein|nr:antitoxin [Actinomycetales bacterium]